METEGMEEEEAAEMLWEDLEMEVREEREEEEGC